MTPLTYVALIKPQPGGLLVTFPDVPEAITQGDTWADAERNANDALAAALEGYQERGLSWPMVAFELPANAAPGERFVLVPVDPDLLQVPSRILGEL